MEASRRLLTFELAGQSSAEDFKELFESVDDLYNLRFFLELLRDESREIDPLFYELLATTRRFDRKSRPFPRAARIVMARWLVGRNPPPLDEAQLSRVSSAFQPDERLEVRRIEYASPGSLDLLGIGAIVGHVKDFTAKLIDRHDNNISRELDEERSALENERLRIENAKSYVSLARDLGYSEAELREMMLLVDRRQGPLAPAKA